MAGRLERAHAEFVGQGLLVVDFGLRDLGRISVGIDGTKLVQRQRLVPACLVLSGQGKRLARVLPGLLAVLSQVFVGDDLRYALTLTNGEA